MRWAYLDNNATTRPAPEVVAAMQEIHEQHWANPSSVHRPGQLVRRRVELARAAVARLLGVRDRDVVFTSGGTESNNLALRGTLEPVLARVGPGGACLITTGVEHVAVREPAERLAEAGADLIDLPVDGAGRVDPAALGAALADRVGDRPALVSIQWANNETGVLQPMAALGEVCRRHRAAGRPVVFHSDATQAVGKIPVDPKAVGVDLLCFSGHKFHGPKGTGGLYVGRGMRLQPQSLGGPQERERRGGTEHVAGIVGTGVAAELAQVFLADADGAARIGALRDRLERDIGAAVEVTVVNGAAAGADGRLWNTSNIGFPRLEAEALLLGLSERGVCASAGAACSSGSLEPSVVLLAMGVPEPVAHGSLRFSLSRFTVADEIEAAVRTVALVVERLARTLPLG